MATGSLEAAGLALSPYTINGRKRWFLEPPHMQSSQIFLPRKEQPPAIGDEIPVELRLTTATVDAVDCGSLAASDPKAADSRTGSSRSLRVTRQQRRNSGTPVRFSTRLIRVPPSES